MWAHCAVPAMDVYRVLRLSVSCFSGPLRGYCSREHNCWESTRSGDATVDHVAVTVDRLARLTLTATLAFGIAACAVVEAPVVVDSCELVVRNADHETLEPPYEVTMIRRSTGVEEG